MPPTHRLVAEPDLADNIAAHIEEDCMPTRHAAALYGVPEPTLERWLAGGQLADGPEVEQAFYLRIEKARAIRAQKLIEDMRAAEDSLWKRDAFLLERLEPKDFAKKSKHEVTGKDGGPMEVIQRANRDLDSKLDSLSARIEEEAGAAEDSSDER